MDTRLTERLREQTFSSVEPTRRRQRAAKAPLAGQGAYGYNSPYGYAYSGYATPGAATRSAASSPYQGSAYSQFGGVPTELYPQEPASESLKIYSDLFEEVIERDRVFGSLLRKVKAAYDSHLTREVGAVPPMPGVAESLPKALPRGLASEPVLAPEVSQVDASQPWELHRENQALKDLIERLHMELEVAVKREQRWKNKASKLKARANASRLSSSTQLMAPAQETPSYWAGAGHGFPQMDAQWDAMGALGARGPLHEPRFHLHPLHLTGKDPPSLCVPGAEPIGPPLTLTPENVEVVLQEARYHHMQNCFGYVEESTGAGISGKVDLVEVEGPMVIIHLYGAFWHKREDVLRRVKKYLIQRIPEIADVDVEDPDDLVDEGRDRSGTFYHRH
ncbi:unnamed protein product [Symbiodinium sp. CCMP2456]|nr:unnamed protein product [Symbiodinium sp. CCMP2456]